MLRPESQELLDKFKQLTLEEQKEKIKTMANMMLEQNPVWQEVVETIDTNENVDSEFTENIYTSFMEFNDTVKQGEQEKANKALEKTANYLKDLKAREQAEKEEEKVELDTMIDEIENL